MGSDSDLPIVEKGIEVVQSFGVPVEVRIISAHRTPAEAESFARNAEA
ncbi:MAG: AIR carboxylase family protein, partial [Niameybacter sp.]